jgi:microcystin-dependent protein
MITFTGAATPDVGCAFLNGQAISRAANPVVFARYGTAYGTGDGTTTFNLPDAKGCIFAHPDQGAGRLTSTYFGVSPTLGVRGGLESNTLDTTRMPAHRHSAAIYDTGHAHGVSGGVYGGTTSFQRPRDFAADATAPYSASPITINPAATGVRVNSDGGLDTTYPVGGDGAHANVQPTLIQNAQIKLG